MSPVGVVGSRFGHCVPQMCCIVLPFVPVAGKRGFFSPPQLIPLWHDCIDGGAQFVVRRLVFKVFWWGDHHTTGGSFGLCGSTQGCFGSHVAIGYSFFFAQDGQMCDHIDGGNVTGDDAQSGLIFAGTFDDFFDATFQRGLDFGRSFDQFEKFFGQGFAGQRGSDGGKGDGGGGGGGGGGRGFNFGFFGGGTVFGVSATLLALLLLFLTHRALGGSRSLGDTGCQGSSVCVFKKAL